MCKKTGQFRVSLFDLCVGPEQKVEENLEEKAAYGLYHSDGMA